MLFELLAGQPPFSAEGGGKVLGMHMFVAPPLLQTLAPDTPTPLADLVQRLLAKEKEDRPNMRQLATTLEQLGEQHPLAKRSGKTRALGMGDDEVPEVTVRFGGGLSTFGLSAAQTLKRNPHLRRLGTVIGGAALTLGIVATIVFSSGDGNSERPHPRNAGTMQAKRITLRIESDRLGSTGCVVRSVYRARSEAVKRAHGRDGCRHRAHVSPQMRASRRIRSA